MGSRRAVWVSAAAAVLVAVGVAPSIADVDDLADRSVTAVEWGVSAECRRIAPDAASDERCAAVDGRPVSAARVDAYRASWVHRALTLQRAVDDDAPLSEALLVHTHNSFNSSSYDPTLTNQDPNQAYSLTDQLEMDVRALELDVHWVPSPFGTLETGGRWPTLCHGNSGNPLGVHVGCSVDRPLEDGLREIRAWLDDPAHASEVVLLYLENQLDDDPLAHEVAGSILARELGSLVLRTPASAPCAAMDWSRTRASIASSGARVVVVGNCSPAVAGGWGALVHERGPRWDEHGDPSAYSPDDCAADRTARTSAPFGGGPLRRFFEDSTWIAAAAGSNPATSSLGGTSTISADTTAAMVRCGANLIGFDQLSPEDPRLAALVWSWSPDVFATQRPAGGGCAYQGADTRWHVGDCRTRRRAACASDGGRFSVSPRAVPFARAAAACAALGGLPFAAPVSGLRNALLAEAKPPGSPEVWVRASLAS